MENRSPRKVARLSTEPPTDDPVPPTDDPVPSTDDRVAFDSPGLSSVTLRTPDLADVRSDVHNSVPIPLPTLVSETAHPVSDALPHAASSEKPPLTSADATLHLAIQTLYALVADLERVPIFNGEPIATAHRQASRDLEVYRLGYPDHKPNMPSMSKNLLFYKNLIRSKPDNAFVSDFHLNWWHAYDELEYGHGFIQWLFPIHEHGMNGDAQVLQEHEAVAMRDDAAVHARLIKSYELMLDFYGFKLLSRETGVIAPSKNAIPRFKNLSTHSHNFLRITRILKCLGELGLEHFKAPFLCEVLRQIIVEGNFRTAGLLRSCEYFWIGTLKVDADREALVDLMRQFSKETCPHRAHGGTASPDLSD